MSKTVLFRFLLAGALVLAAVLWLLSVVLPDAFEWFGLAWAAVIFCGGAGGLYILRAMGFFGGTNAKRLYLFCAAAFLVVALFALVSVLALPDNTVLPLIAVILSGVILIGVLATGGKKWDQGDNQNVGYKNYHRRKADEEKAAARAEKKNGGQ